MTVKDIANELGISKPTVSKVMQELGIQPQKVSNRFTISDKDFNLIKTKILQKSQNKKSPISQNKTEKSPISIFEKQICILQEQLTVKDKQLAEKDKQITNLTEALKIVQEQQKELMTALTAAQALHAGTIQKELEDSTTSSNNVLEKKTQKSKNFFAFFFRRKNKH